MTPPSHHPALVAVEARYLHLINGRDYFQTTFVTGDRGFMTPMAFHGDGGFAGSPDIAGKAKQPMETPVLLYGEVPGRSSFQQEELRDRLIVLQAQQQKAAISDRQRQFFRHLATAIDNEVNTRMKAMDDAMDAAKTLNWALDARVQSLTIENHIWRELAQSNEAAANLLRADLEQAITAHICVNEDYLQGDPAVDDGESCCGESEDSNNVVALPWVPARICRNCRRNEPTVLLLPCRHLCLCSECGPRATFCPICDCFTSGTVHVNLS